MMVTILVTAPRAGGDRAGLLSLPVPNTASSAAVTWLQPRPSAL